MGRRFGRDNKPPILPTLGMILSNFLPLPKPQFSYLKNGQDGTSPAYLKGLWKINISKVDRGAKVELRIFRLIKGVAFNSMTVC